MTVILDSGPFYHGTRAQLEAGGLLTAGFRSNYRPEVVMNHIYFTALTDGAGSGGRFGPRRRAAPRLSCPADRAL